MITFYPCEIDMWKTDEFDFSDRGKSVITLVCKQITDYKSFHDRAEFIDFLKDHGIKLDTYFLQIVKIEDSHPYIDGITHKVMHDKLLGWIKDDLR